MDMITFDNSNLHDRVYIHLRDKILNNELEPGSKIVYEDLIQELGVSRTPLRDAINRLKIDGLIEVKPRSGSYVYYPNRKDIEDLFGVRKALECQAVKDATELMPKSELKLLMNEADVAEEAIRAGEVNTFFEADRKLHKSIIQHSNNHLLFSIMSTLELRIIWYGVIMTKSSERPLKANETHKKILQAMYDSDGKMAVGLMEEHIDELKSFTLKDYAKSEHQTNL